MPRPGVTARVDLLDVNVWVALSASAHPHHARAHRYWRDESGERLAFCRIALLGFLRLTTNATVMGGQPLTAEEAWAAYSAWRRLDDVVVVNEPDGCDLLLAAWIGRGIIMPRRWTAAYLAAFARAGGLRLVSFDRDFTRFDGLDLLQLEV
jgi:toxin-antitoxin system PIN domain toxin